MNCLISLKEYNALSALHQSTQGTFWNFGIDLLANYNIYYSHPTGWNPWNFDSHDNNNLTNILSNPCTSGWEGIRCEIVNKSTSENPLAICTITALDLGKHNLRGYLPSEIGDLKNLEVNYFLSSLYNVYIIPDI